MNSPHPTTVAVIVAGGSGSRMGSDTVPKQIMPLAGMPVIARTIRAFDACSQIDRVVIVSRETETDLIARLLSEVPARDRYTVVQGGKTRTASVARGIAAAGNAAYLVIHDAVRCLITSADIERVIDAAYRDGAATAASPMIDTVKKIKNGLITDTVDRDCLITVQTPQVFRSSLFLPLFYEAERQGLTYTDDCSIMEQAGIAVTPVYINNNLKLTYPSDFKLAAALIAQKGEEPTMTDCRMRIGHGYDVHRLVPERPLVLGGVRLAYHKGLDGHSDADVLVHAVIDALLGAAGMPDIGTLFPDTDDRYLGADSLVLLSDVADRLKRAGYDIANVDATVIAQAPRLSPFVPQMKKNIAAALGCSDHVINVKATTEEHLGFTGAGEGIAAHSVCLLCLVGSGTV